VLDLYLIRYGGIVMEKKKSKGYSYKDLFTEKQFLKSVIANTFGRLGDSIDSIAYAWMVYQITGSKTWLAIIWGVNTLPSILFQPFAGALIENLNQKRVIVFCDFSRGLIVFITGMLMLFNKITPLYLVIFTFINSTLESFRMPAGNAILPKILSKDKYPHGIALKSTISRFAELIGFGVAGFLIGAIGTGGAIIVDSVTFILCSIIMSTIKFKEVKEKKVILNVKNYFLNLKDGFAYFKTKDILFTICIFGCIINVIILPTNTLQAAYVSESLNLGAQAISVSGVCMTAGMFLGTVIYPSISKYMSRRKIFNMSWIFMGLFYFSLVGMSYVSGDIAKYLFYGVTSILLGLLAATLNMITTVLFMSLVDDDYIGRAGGIFNSLVSSSMPLASFGIAAIAPFFSVNQIYSIFGILAIVVYLLCIKLKVLKNL